MGRCDTVKKKDAALGNALVSLGPGNRRRNGRSFAGPRAQARGPAYTGVGRGGHEGGRGVTREV